MYVQRPSGSPQISLLWRAESQEAGEVGRVGSLGVLLGLCLKSNEELFKDFNQECEIFKCYNFKTLATVWRIDYSGTS